MWMDNVSIKRKLLLTPVMLILILIAITYTSVTLLSRLSNDMETISYNLAPDTELTAEMLDIVYGLRLTVKNFIQTGDNAYVEQFNQDATIWTHELVKRAYQEIQNPTRLTILDEINDMRSQYLNVFSNSVVHNMETRNNLVNNTLNVIGPDIEHRLTSLMQEAKNRGNINAAYHAGLTLRSLLLARLYVFKFLVENQPSQIARFNKEIHACQLELTPLSAALNTNDDKAQISEIRNWLTEYTNTANRVAQVIYERNKGIQKLDTIGPQLALKLSELRDSISTSMEIATTAAQHDTQTSEKTLFLIAFIAASVGMLFSFIVIRAISAKIKTTNDILSDVIRGNVDPDKRIPVYGRDEFATLARNYNEFADRLKDLTHYHSPQVSSDIRKSDVPNSATAKTTSPPHSFHSFRPGSD